MNQITIQQSHIENLTRRMSVIQQHDQKCSDRVKDLRDEDKSQKLLIENMQQQVNFTFIQVYAMYTILKNILYIDNVKNAHFITF